MGNIEGFDQAFLSINFIKFVNKKALDKMGEKKNEKPLCDECKGFRYIRNERLNLIKEEENDKKKEKEEENESGKEKEKKVLQATLKSDGEDELKELLQEFYFVENDEELQKIFEDMYQNFINVNRINKDLKMIVQTLSSENKGLKPREASREQKNEVLTSANKELVVHLTEKNVELYKILVESQIFSNKFLIQKSPLCQLGLGGK